MVLGICFQCLMLHEIRLHPFSLENVPDLDRFLLQEIPSCSECVKRERDCYKGSASVGLNSLIKATEPGFCLNRLHTQFHRSEN